MPGRSVGPTRRIVRKSTTIGPSRAVSAIVTPADQSIEHRIIQGEQIRIVRAVRGSFQAMPRWAMMAGCVMESVPQPIGNQPVDADCALVEGGTPTISVPGGPVRRMIWIVLVALLTLIPSLAAAEVCGPRLIVDFEESAPKDYFRLKNASETEWRIDRVEIDLRGSGGLIFDVTGRGAGVSVYQPFERPAVRPLSGAGPR